MPRKFNISFKEDHSAKAGTKSNINFGPVHRLSPFKKMKDIINTNWQKPK